MKESKMPAKRLQHYVIIAVLTILLSVLFAYLSGLGADTIFSYLLTDTIFLAVVLYMLESSRLLGRLGIGLSSNYGRIADWYGIC